MKINEHKAILTPRVLLVPYSTHHVPTYHSWMQDEEIQKATASEPLSLPAEHAMQQSWRLDHDKLTFIICRAPSSESTTITPEVDDTPDTMIGDVNLFLYDASDDEDQSEHGSRPVLAELEIMIAPHRFRRQGFARESLLAFVSYVTANLDGILEEYRLGCDERSERYLTYLRVKIDQDNAASVKLFGGLGFEKKGGVNYFGEVEMRVGVKDGEVVGLNGGAVGKVVGYGV